MRFTLSKLFSAVTMLAIACAGLTLRTEVWAEAIVTLSAVLYVLVALLAIGRTGPARAASLAFVIVGGGYLLLVLCSMFSPMRDLLITNRALIMAGKALQVETNEATIVAPASAPYTAVVKLLDATKANRVSLPAGVASGTVNLSRVYQWEPEFGFGTQTPNPKIPAGAFLIVGQCVWSWLFALVCGSIAGAIYAKRARGAA